MQGIRHCFYSIRLTGCPQTLSRIIGWFAQRDQPITAMSLAGNGKDQLLVIEVVIRPDHAVIISEKIRTVINVLEVRLSVGRLTG